MAFRFLIKLCVIVAICFAVGSYLVYLKTGCFWMPSWSNVNISMPAFLGGGDATLEPVTSPTEPTYKWWANGQWNYGQTPPEGVNAIRLDKE